MSFLQEKEDFLLPSSAHPNPVLSRRHRLLRVFVFTISTIALASWLQPLRIEELSSWYKCNQVDRVHQATCPQVDTLVPDINAASWKAVGDVIGSDAFKLRAIDWLSSAVQIPTETYDDLGPVGLDKRWEAFEPFHRYLLGAYPQVHGNLKLVKVNTYGLLYEWTGSDSTLKPFLLAAHQDVVPVNPNTFNEWTHPPYSGHFDGERIWGRGSSDDKNGLIGILSAIELLVEHDFRPTRTVVLAFGFDEESRGGEGAAKLSKAMLEFYGKDSFAFIVDEGGGYAEEYGSIFATPGITEKGALDTRIEVASPGGHSSVPPIHTSIGILSALLVKLEQNPYEARISTDAPLYKTFQCYAEHSKDMPSKLRSALKSSPHSKKALNRAEKLLFENPMYKSVFQTTQAIDLVGGGVKTNALPEQAWAVVNHRIHTLSSVNETMVRDTHILKEIAHEFNLTYEAFGASISNPSGPSKGSLVISDAFGTALEPAPVTPISGDEATPYQLLSGSIKATYNAHRGLNGNNIVVAPGMNTGNSDTRFYWALSEHIFRYNHENAVQKDGKPLGGIHTVNESIDVDSFLEMIRFFTTLILNADEAELP